MKKNLKGTEEFVMYQDFYKIYQEYYFPEDKDEWWDEALAAIEMFYRKYNSTIARDLANIIVNNIERRSLMQKMYDNNKNFKDFIDKYCLKHDVDKETAFEHMVVKNVFDDFRKKEANG